MGAAATVNSNQPDRNQILLASSGVLGPILFTAIVIILGFLHPGYSHASQAVSELGAVGAPNAAAQAVNFLLLGLLTLAFAVGLHRGIGGGEGSKGGPALLAAFAISGGFGSAAFPCDLG